MKKKRKRSASSSSSSRSSSPSSSSSSSRRRSKKKKKKRRRSERGSKRHRRISSRESRRSEEGKKDRKENEEEDEVEWYPAPPNTSATFLNQKGGFGERNAEEKEVEDKRICQLYSLSAASEDEESDRDRKRRDRERTRGRRNSPSRSPERVERSRERRDRSRERRGSDSKRRSSLDENRKRKVSCSSAESEYSRKSNFKSEYLGNSGSASKQVSSRVRHDSSKRNSFDGGRYENRGREEIREVEEAKREDRKGREESSRSDGGNGKRLEGAGHNNKPSSLTSVPGGRPQKDLPSNLLDIFNQIAKFEKEKGGKLK